VSAEKNAPKGPTEQQSQQNNIGSAIGSKRQKLSQPPFLEAFFVSSTATFQNHRVAAGQPSLRSIEGAQLSGASGSRRPLGDARSTVDLL